MTSGQPESGGCGCGAFAAFVLALVCALAVFFGSFGYRTTRVYGGTDVNATTIAQEGAGRWAIWTALAGAAAFGALGCCGWAVLARHEGLGAILAAMAAPAFAIAVLVAGSNWVRILNEEQRQSSYTVAIAPGLPIVALAAGGGVVLALLLAALLVVGRRAEQASGNRPEDGPWSGRYRSSRV